MLNRRGFVASLASVAVAAPGWPRRARAATASPPSFPLKVSESRRHLVDAQGKPFLVLGDTPWFVQRLKLDDARRVLDDRQARGFNTLFLEILDDSRIPSVDGHGNPAFATDTDITRPVEAYWKYTDELMEEAARRGFFVIMSDLWYGAGRGLWMHHIRPETVGVYGKFLGQRYARFDNLMWMHCGDRNPDAGLAECARVLARSIREQAPRHLHTAHLAHEFASSASFHQDDWLDVNMAYTYGASYKHLRPEYERADPIRPVLLGETGYEDEPNAIELLPDASRGDLWTPFLIRRNAYWALLSGACGYCAGSRLWRWEPRWKEVLNVRSSREAPLIRKLLEPRPWWRLVPEFEGGFVKDGQGEWGQADHVARAVADDGSFALAYVPAPRALSVDLTRLAGPLKGAWFDPTSAEMRPIDGAALAPEPPCRLDPPGKNSAGEGDWVLVLEKT